jgi:hypothetical protein
MLFIKKIKNMFITLKYIWNNYWQTLKQGKPNMRAFLIFLRMLGVEIKCLLLTGYSTYNIYKSNI